MRTPNAGQAADVGARTSGARSMSDGITDRVLVERAARGDSIAFSELVNRHYRRAVRVAFGILKDAHDAEDVVQDAFSRVYRRLATFDGGASFYTWLYRIVVNLSIDTLRKRKRDRRIDNQADDAARALELGRGAWPGFDDTCPDGAAERRDLAKKLRRAFQDLPEIHQAVLMLRELEGLSYEEIAKTLGIKKGTVMSRLFNARRIMQTRLLELEAEESNETRGEHGSVGS